MRDKLTPSSFPHFAQSSEYEPIIGNMQVAVAKMVERGAEGGSRTRTSFRTTDFKSAASAIPPPRHVVRNPKYTKNSVSLKTPVASPRYVGAGKMRDYSMAFRSKLEHDRLVRSTFLRPLPMLRV